MTGIMGKPLDDEAEECLLVKEKADEEKPPKKGISLMGFAGGLFSGLFFSACAACVKSLGVTDSGEISWLQNVVVAWISWTLIVINGHSLLAADNKQNFWILVCALLDALTEISSFVSFKYLPLSDCSVYTATVPFFVTISARIFLKEKCGLLQTVAVIVSFAGITIVSKAPGLMSPSNEVYDSNYFTGLLATIVSICSESAVYITLKKLNDVHIFVKIFNFSVVGGAVIGICNIPFGDNSFSLCPNFNKLMIVLIGVFNFLSQLLLTRSLETEEAGLISILMAAGDMLLSFILDIAYFGETPGLYTIIGAALVVFSVLLAGFQDFISDWWKKGGCSRKQARYICIV